MRKAKIIRKTNETSVELEINLDGTGKYDIDLELGFLKHMLELFSKQSLIDLKLTAKGDLEVDDHHTTEDIAIVLGQALKDAIGDKKGIKRYGSMTLPMDEVLVVAAIDLSGRFSFETNYEAVREQVGDFSTEMMKHFFESVAVNAGMNLHIQYLNPGDNEHHRLEAAFKSFGRALRQAVSIDERCKNLIPSTKGKLG
ncbi:imidazoleglycerol-phosphate dehydratase HisB [Candidatus Gracilibacteria bacterium]|nr:imidazoleglycerol-phosphate dehydratase HisB [Candidatus Gracilibacteria bacterium]